MFFPKDATFSSIIIILLLSVCLMAWMSGVESKYVPVPLIGGTEQKDTIPRSYVNFKRIENLCYDGAVLATFDAVKKEDCLGHCIFYKGCLAVGMKLQSRDNSTSPDETKAEKTVVVCELVNASEDCAFMVKMRGVAYVKDFRNGGKCTEFVAGLLSDNDDGDGSDDDVTDGDGSNGAGSNGAGSNGAGSNGAGSNGAGSNGAGSNGAGSNGAGSDVDGSDNDVTDGEGGNGAGSDVDGSNRAGSDVDGSNGAGSDVNGSDDSSKDCSYARALVGKD